MNLEKLDKTTLSLDDILSSSLELENASLSKIDLNAHSTIFGFGPLVKFSDDSVRFNLTNSLGFNHPLLLKWYFDDDIKDASLDPALLDRLQKSLDKLLLDKEDFLPFLDFSHLKGRDTTLICSLLKLLELDEFLSENGRLGQVKGWISKYFSEYSMKANQVSIDMPNNDFVKKLRDNGIIGIENGNSALLIFPLMIKEVHIEKVAEIIRELRNV